MGKIVLRPDDGSPMRCAICDSSVAQGSIFSHLKIHHDLSIAQYRDRFNIPTQCGHGRGKFWLGKKAVNRKHKDLITKVQCHICGKELEMDTRWHQHRLAKGKIRFSCQSGIKGKRSDCCKKLQALTIKEVRGTKESRAKTSAQMTQHWSDPKTRAKYGAQMKAKSPAWHTKRLAASLKTNLSGKQTKIERKVEDFIKASNFPFKYTGDGSFSVGPLFPDFVSTDDSKVIIDVHGCYWHRCAKCFPNSKTTTLPFKQRVSTYAKHGYRTLVIWEHELNDADWRAKLLIKIKSVLPS